MLDLLHIGIHDQEPWCNHCTGQLSGGCPTPYAAGEKRNSRDSGKEMTANGKVCGKGKLVHEASPSTTLRGATGATVGRQSRARISSFGPRNFLRPSAMTSNWSTTIIALGRWAMTMAMPRRLLTP